MQIRDRVKELRRVRAGDLRPSPRNWRTHPKRQREALQAVLAEVGYADALLAREVDGGALELIDGHLRAETTPDMHVPVLVLDVTEAEAGTPLATLDPLAALATADADKLDALLRDVHTDSEPLAAMLADLAAQNGVISPQQAGGGGDDFDASPQPDGPTRANVGELWAIGGVHRLLVGDCTVPENVERLMAGEKPFLMVTDPPYGVDYEPEWRHEAAAKRLIGFSAKRNGKVANDDRLDWTEAYKLFGGQVAYCWHADRHASSVQSQLEAAGFKVRSQIIWAKDSFSISRGHYHWQHEPCWYAVRNDETANWAGDRSQSTLWRINKNDGEDTGTHGTQKPFECMARPIRNHGAPGDLVYDPFLGSGTTLIAAHRLGRRCYGCEIEPRYADVILRRTEAEGLACELL